LGGGDGLPAAVAVRQVEGACDSPRRYHGPHVGGKGKLQHGDPYHFARPDAGGELDEARLLAWLGELVVETALRRAERRETHLEPLVRASRAEPRPSDSDPRGHVTTVDVRRREHAQGRRDAGRRPPCVDARVGVALRAGNGSRRRAGQSEGCSKCPRELSEASAGHAGGGVCSSTRAHLAPESGPAQPQLWRRSAAREGRPNRIAYARGPVDPL